MTYCKLYSRCSATEFVEFWEGFYRSTIPDDVYQANLNIGNELTMENVALLWRWKNQRYGSPLIGPTQQILGDINAFRRLESIEEQEERGFWERAYAISPRIVWQVFLFHMARPDDYPIFDRHVMRSYTAITTGYLRLNPREANMVCRSYDRFRSSYGGYRDFFLQMVKETGFPPKKVDRALWAFGRHLRRQHRADGPLPIGN